MRIIRESLEVYLLMKYLKNKTILTSLLQKLFPPNTALKFFFYSNCKKKTVQKGNFWMIKSKVFGNITIQENAIFT